MMLPKKRILIFVDWFEPGFRAGGPIRSVVNIVQHLKNEFDLFVVTSDRDHGESIAYSGVQSNEFIKIENYQVLYASPRYLSRRIISSIIKQISPDWLYLNSMFSWAFSILPLTSAIYSNPIKCIILAPRGMLGSSALQFKKLKKLLFIRIFKLIHLHRKIIFQATSEEEIKDINLLFGLRVKTIFLQNLPEAVQQPLSTIEKRTGSARLIFIGRIHPIKNLNFLLQILRTCSFEIVLTIVGKKEDRAFWQVCKDLIADLPQNISVNIHEEVPHKGITDLLLQNHVFALPTKGENFGYAIYESLCVGRPVLISNQTPWRNLEAQKAGWDIDLKEPAKFKEAIEKIAAMDKLTYGEWAEGAYNYAKKFNETSDLKSRYIRFFTAPESC